MATITVAGTMTGAANSMWNSNGAPPGTSDSASAREAVYMPWATTPGMLSAFAVRPVTWIGFQSPETFAHVRPMEPGIRHCAVGRGTLNCGRFDEPVDSASGSTSSSFLPLARYTEVSSTRTSPSRDTVDSCTISVPERCARKPATRTSTSTSEPTGTGFSWRYVLDVWIRPIIGSGKSSAAMSSICSGMISAWTWPKNAPLAT